MLAASALLPLPYALSAASAYLRLPYAAVPSPSMMPSLSSKHSALARAARIPRLFVIMVRITPLAVMMSVAIIPLHLTSAAQSETLSMSVVEPRGGDVGDEVLGEGETAGWCDVRYKRCKIHGGG